jgi:hypothetical protein
MNQNMKKRLALALIVPLLIIMFAPPFYPGDCDSQGLNYSDGYGQFFALASPFVHFERDPKWVAVAYSIELPYLLPQVLPPAADSRAPPA